MCVLYFGWPNQPSSGVPEEAFFIVPEEGWFGQPKYSTHIKTFLRCTGFCLYFLHFIYVKPVRSPLIQRTPAGSSFRLLAQTFYSHLLAFFFNTNLHDARTRFYWIPLPHKHAVGRTAVLLPTTAFRAVSPSSEQIVIRYLFMVEIWPLSTCLVPHFHSATDKAPRVSLEINLSSVFGN